MECPSEDTRTFFFFHTVPFLFVQETGVLIVFDEDERDSTYDDVLETIGAMSKVVDRLYKAAQKLS